MITKGKIVKLDQQSDDWHKWRSSGIGASESAIVMMGEDYPYQSNIQKLWAMKMGLVTEDFSEEAKVRMAKGHKFEPVARELFTKSTGIYVVPECYEHFSHNFIKASVDGISLDGEVITEIKCPSNRDRHQKVYDSRELYEEYYIQMQHQFLVTGASIGYFVSYFKGFNENPSDDLVIVEVKPEYSYIQEIFRRMIKLWEYVETNVMPLEGALSDNPTFLGKVGLTMVSGYAQSGKDLLTSGFNSVTKSVRYGFADKLKLIYCEIAGISMEELTTNKESHRSGLVALGREMRTVYPDVWVRGIFDNPKLLEDSASYGAVISDVRYLNEYNYGYLFCKNNRIPKRSIWIDSSEIGNKPANEEEAKTTYYLQNIADVKFINDVKIEDEKKLKEAISKVVVKILNGFTTVRLSDNI